MKKFILHSENSMVVMVLLTGMLLSGCDFSTELIENQKRIEQDSNFSDKKETRAATASLTEELTYAISRQDRAAISHIVRKGVNLNKLDPHRKEPYYAILLKDEHHGLLKRALERSDNAIHPFLAPTNTNIPSLFKLTKKLKKAHQMKREMEIAKRSASSDWLKKKKKVNEYRRKMLKRSDGTIINIDFIPINEINELIESIHHWRTRHNACFKEIEQGDFIGFKNAYAYAREAGKRLDPFALLEKAKLHKSQQPGQEDLNQIVQYLLAETKY